MEAICVHEIHHTVYTGKQNLRSTINVLQIHHMLEFQCEIVFNSLVIEVEKLDELLEDNCEVQSQGRNCDFNWLLEESMSEELTHLL